MTYLNTHDRTTSSTGNDTFQPTGRTPALFGIFVGYVKDATDVQRNGRLRVWIPEMGSAPNNQDGWTIVNYCSPFAGATNVETTSKSDTQSFDGTQTSYGMWMVPPDVNNQVLIMFVNGDPSRGICIGSLYNQYMNNMVPGMAASASNYQYPGHNIPVAEYNKWDTKVTQPDRAIKPYEKTKFNGLGNQGLITDPERGTTTSSARRESPSSVFGILTPGPVIDKNVAADKIRRKGGSALIMDDGTDSEYIQFTTKTGAQIRIDETHGFVYLINRDGTAWIQMDQTGNIDIFGAGDISMRAQRDFNIRADRNVNIEAGQNLFMKAAKDTTKEETTFTYNVNNIPVTKKIPVWNYKGEGKGEGGNIVLQALNNLQETITNTAYLTVVNNNLNVSIGNNINLTTKTGGMDFSSNKGIRMTTNAAFDLATTGNIRIGSNGSVNVVGATGIIMCSSADLTLKAVGNIIEAAAGDVQIIASNLGVTAPVKFSSTLGVVGSSIIAGGLQATVSSGGSVSPPPSPNPANAQPAMSANSAPIAEVKPLNDKINILATWQDVQSKFKRNSSGLQTTVSRFPTYEPCPEHDKFKFTKVANYKPVVTSDDKTYEGSGGAGNQVTSSPPPATNPGANNTSIMPDPISADDNTKDINIDALRCQLTIHEGLKKTSYLDSVGLLTGGIGHLLRSNEVTQYPLGSPISDDLIESWYTQDSNAAIKIAQILVGDIWSSLSDIRKRAVTDLAYNLGQNRLSQFVNFLSAMKSEDFNKAGQELRNSKWFTQVGRRGPNIVTMIVQSVDVNQCDKKFPV